MLFLFDFVNFWSENKLYIIIGGVVLLLIIVVIIVLASRKGKKKKILEEIESIEKTTIPTTPKENVEAAVSDETPVTKEEPKEASPSAEDTQDLGESNSKSITEVTIVEEETTPSPQEEVTPSSQDKNMEEAKAKRKYLGKWVIKRRNEKEFTAYLYSSNGELLLTSEAYSTQEGALSGIDTIKKNIAADNFKVYTDKHKKYYFKLKTSTNRLLSLGEVYPQEKYCLNAINSIKHFYAEAKIAEEIQEDTHLIDYVPSDLGPVSETYRGKWIMNTQDGFYSGSLLASNGGVLLTTEWYSSKSQTIKAIDNLIVNINKNNFIIDVDKNKHYFYRLRNESNSTLAIGEAYATVALCISSIDSVRKFARSAELIKQN